MKSEAEVKRLHDALMSALARPDGFDLVVSTLRWVLDKADPLTDALIKQALECAEEARKQIVIN